MNLVLVADIFGDTPALRAIANELAPKFNSVCLVDPYNRAQMDFENETAAYAYFKEHVGLDRYIQIVSEALSQIRDHARLLGFSVGAAAIWMLSANQDIPQQSKAICFYGSQIRHFLTVSPQIEMELFFPHYEPHFDVMALMDHLSRNRNVRCCQTAYLHGFMNKDSANFDAKGYRRYLQIIKDRFI